LLVVAVEDQLVLVGATARALPSATCQPSYEAALREGLVDVDAGLAVTVTAATRTCC